MMENKQIQLASSGNRGFTIIEMAIVLTILALVLGGGLSIAASMIETEKSDTTTERMNTIMTTLKQYAEAKDQLPCPADGTIAWNAANFGVGTGTGTPPGGCTAANETVSVGDVVAGVVPVGTLGLDPIYMLDGWNRRITYVVDEDLTFPGPSTDSGDDDVDNEGDPGFEEEGFMNGNVPTGDIEILDEDDNHLSTRLATAAEGAANQILGCDGIEVSNAGDCIPVRVAVLIISHGKNGHGAWKVKGAAQEDDNRAEDRRHMEDDNSHQNTTTNPTYDATYRSMPLREQPASPTGTLALGDQYFDDILMYWTKWQLKN